MPRVVQHSSASNEWGTPDCVLEPARRVGDGIGFDPFTSSAFNKRVQARAFCSRDGLKLDWPKGGLVLVNPPGNAHHEDNFPARAYRKLMEQRDLGRVDHAIWVGFTVEHLRHCQPQEYPPLASFPMCFPRERLKFVRPDGTPGDSPAHANVIVYIPGNLDRTDRFIQEFWWLGACRT